MLPIDRSTLGEMRGSEFQDLSSAAMPTTTTQSRSCSSVIHAVYRALPCTVWPAGMSQVHV